MNLESNIYERVNEIVDGLRFRSFDKVYSSIKSEMPNVNLDVLRAKAREQSSWKKNKFIFVILNI